MKEPEIDLPEEVQQLLANCVGNALTNARYDVNERKLRYKNGRGLNNLNYIFNEVYRHSGKDFLVTEHKRGPFEFVLAYDKQSKALIIFASKKNVRVLQGRIAITTSHYIDALLSINTGYRGDYVQGTLFDKCSAAPTESQREELCEKLLATIKSSEVDKCIICEYDIMHKDFSLRDLNCVLYSKNFVKLNTLSILRYVSFSDYTPDSIVNKDLIEERDAIGNIEQKLDIKLKNKA